jgi:hypothetical protein
MLGSTLERSSATVSLKHRLGRPGRMEESLLFHVGLDQGDTLFGAAGKAKILQGHLVNRKDGAGGPVLGRHIPDGRPVGQGQAGEARPVEFHELAHHTLAAEKLGHREHQVRRRGPLG